MAFVYEREKPPLFPINRDTALIGPGQYLPLSLYKFDKPNTVPFGRSSKKGFEFGSNDVPGPGSYDSKKSKKISFVNNGNKISQKKEKKAEKLLKNSKIKIMILKNSESEKRESKECLGFNTKVERFKKIIENNSPGPGWYDDKNIQLAKTIEEICYNKKDLIYRTNNDRHSIFFVNRKNNQFPWNSEIEVTKKNSKKHLKHTKSENEFQNKNLLEIISKKKIEEKKINRKNDTSSPKIQKIEPNIKIQKLPKEKNEPHKKESLDKKSSTTINFFSLDKESILKNSKLSKKEIKEKLAQFMVEYKRLNDIQYRISSIPSKFSLGYLTEEDSGKIMKQPLKTKFKIFSGEKEDSVGPGYYNIDLSKTWRRTGTSWSKYLCGKTITSKNDSIKSEPQPNIMNDNKLDKQYKKVVSPNNMNMGKMKFKPGANSNMCNIYKKYSSTQLIYKDPAAHNIKIQIEKDYPDFVTINNVPGPGYYFAEEDDINKKKNEKYLPRKKINTTKENKDKNSEDMIPGPGAYFNDIFNLNNNPNLNRIKKLFPKSNRVKKKDIPFSCSTKRFDHEKIYNFISKENRKSSKNKNLSHDEDMNEKILLFREKESESNYLYNRLKPKSLSGTFYRRDMRFRENYQDEMMKREIPGPGSYINPYTSTGQLNSVQLEDKFMNIRMCKDFIEKNENKAKIIPKKQISWLESGKNFIPGVGTYEPDKTLTIQYDVRNKMKYGNYTFNSSQHNNRNFIYLFQKSSPNGPGSHYHDKFVEYKQNIAAFNSTMNRFYKGGINNTRDLVKTPKRALSVIVKRFDENYDNKGLSLEMKENVNDNENTTNEKVGPGSYSFLPEIYPWIKQSYNVKFCK